MRRLVGRPGAWRGTVRALLALGALLAPAAAHAWTPGTFEAYCGDAAFWVSRDPDQATAAWYVQPGDPDAAGAPGCRAAEQVGWFETALAEALARLASEPFPVDPAPTRLGPVVTGGGGTPTVRFYVRSTGGGYANTVRCLRPEADTLGILSVDRDRVDALSRLSVPYVALHELVHVVQGAQPFETAICGVADLPLWITEGTADAFATRWVCERFPSFAPPPFTSLGRNLLGLRSFSVALAAPDGETAFTQNYSYRSSGFFRFVAERWHAGDHGVWAEAMGVPAPAGNDGLAWLDQVLREPAYGVRQPLALVFPSFLASYAGVVVSLYAFLEDGAWRLEDVPTRHRAALEGASRWLRFGFHGLDAATAYGAGGASAADARDHYGRFVAAARRFAGPAAIDRLPRVHRFLGRRGAVRAWRDAEAGVVGLLTADDDRAEVYHLDADLRARVRADGAAFDPVERLHLVASLPRLEHERDVAGRLDAASAVAPRCVFTHEPDLAGAAVRARVEVAVAWAARRGVAWAFPQDVLAAPTLAAPSPAAAFDAS